MVHVSFVSLACHAMSLSQLPDVGKRCEEERAIDRRRVGVRWVPSGAGEYPKKTQRGKFASIHQPSSQRHVQIGQEERR